MEAILSAILTQLAGQSPWVILLLIAIYWLVKRQDRQVETTQRMAAKQINDNEVKCAAREAQSFAREQAMAVRIASLEESRAADGRQMLTSCLTALHQSAEATTKLAVVADKVLDGDTRVIAALLEAKKDRT